ncbi:MAG: ATP-binding protein [Clostridium chrysemydis]|uniref:sensor histidine kinase n=1 Tax=Clostridium chrysemydis TaxID=2665504 RepID=UPI003F335333
MISRKKDKGEKPKKEKLRVRLKNRFSNSFIGKKLKGLTIRIKFLIERLDRKIKQSVQFELVIAIIVCFLIAGAIYMVTNNLFRNIVYTSVIKYDYDSLSNNAEHMARYIEENRTVDVNGEKRTIDINDNKYFQDVFNMYKHEGDLVFITDLEGDVLRKTPNVSNEKVDIFSILKGISENKYEEEFAVEHNGRYDISTNESKPKEFTALYPISLGKEQYYLIYKAIPTGRIENLEKTVENSFLAMVLAFLAFIILFLIVTKNKMKYIHEISEGLKVIAEGELDYVIPERGEDEISRISKNINIMAREVNKQIEAQKLAEKTKSDLITNVSHDLRTPLTSVMGYIGLVKDGRYDSKEKMKEYLDIAFNKSEQLKALIEDLFEYTKINNSDMTLEKSEVNLVDFISQISEEMKPFFEENDIEQILTLSDEKIILSLDVSKMVRAIENLLTNAVKYSYKPGAVIIGVYKKDNFVTISVKNRGDNIPEEKLQKLFDRFYRLDESRNTNSGGTGLGLAITKNIIERHNGKIWAECYGNDISFYVRFRM